VSTDEGPEPVKVVPPAKRKRKAAGPKIAPLISMPTVPTLSDTEWQPFLQVLSSRPEPESLRSELDRLLTTYLGLLEAEASSPSAREVATVLESVARRAYQFAQDLRRLEIRSRNKGEAPFSEGVGHFNTAKEAAADTLANVLLKPEGHSVLDAAIRASEILGAVADRKAKKLAERSKKGRPTHGEPTAWMLRQLIKLLRDNGVPISLPPKRGNPICDLSQHFLRIALTRAKALREPEWACTEIKSLLNLSEPVFVDRLRRAAQSHGEGLLPI
jgi:hypothetical protein